tara:strand:+ start:204 stop:914 length:711 start_codon:yes stop_codon:yes gene_type:complete
MTTVIIVDKTGKCSEKKCKNFDIDQIHKLCKLKKASKHFKKRHTWKISNDFYVSVYCKSNGRAGSENKYELPPPVDEELYFNNIVIVRHIEEEINSENCENISVEEWQTVYEKLMGGFETLGDESFSEEEEIPDELKTKNGYMKDGFVVDDSDEIVYDENNESDSLDDNLEYDDEEDDDDEDEDDEEEEEEEEEEEDDSDDEDSDDEDFSSPGSELETEDDTDEEEEEEEEEEDDE